MNDSGRFIAGDWGTSNLRLYLCLQQDGQTRVLESCDGPGITGVEGSFEDALMSRAGGWLSEHGRLPIILSGMIGSTLGWRDAPYLECPADAASIAAGRVEFAARGESVCIVAGLRCGNPLGLPDVMRGEELQLLGLVESGGRSGKRLVALPGTHNKWAFLDGGRIEQFLTALTGELFALLSEHSVLIQDASDANDDSEAFMDGVRVGVGASGLSHTLFATRSRQVLGELGAASAAAYLSGMLIGADVAGALSVFGHDKTSFSDVDLVGEPSLCRRYQAALDELGVASRVLDAAELSVAGFGVVYQHWMQQDS